METTLNDNCVLSRRSWLNSALAAVVWSGLPKQACRAADGPKPKSVAAIITAYETGLHADVLLGKIMEGWKQDGGTGPALRLASMYVDQFSPRDLARSMAKKHNVPIFDSIEKAITVGGNSIPVDGVISIGEHGDYPWNEKEQHLYPRRRFFEGITETFQKYGRVVPVFNDKHPGPVWADAKWMYDRARELKFPFMAGSSLAVTFRDPEMSVPMGSQIEAAVGIGYSGLDIYGIHALEAFQCLVERRQGAESGVKRVQYREGDSVWKVLDDGTVSKDAFEAALKLTTSEPGKVRQCEKPSLFLFEYVDGLMGSIFMLPGLAGATAVSVKLKGQSTPMATRFEERKDPHYPHFAYLLKGIERMVHTGKTSYPIERTLLTAGILDRALTSRVQNQEKLITPELAIRYQPVDYPHAPHPDLLSDPTKPL